ncbi:hypothetical protein MRB53_011559 [Persea americana]|uniref:Uncharacterized protein n=1 Tax=Persea americana TaxID=3435 RepID=A0ACC2LWI5_PERAE|nr:hypothetical protein MRB53_011559 [Persea americana]
MPSSSPSAANIWVLLGLGVACIILMARKLNKAVKEDLGAFVERLQLLPPPQPPPPKAPRPLTGLSFAVADVMMEFLWFLQLLILLQNLVHRKCYRKAIKLVLLVFWQLQACLDAVRSLCL